jgi:hypothetical protein
VAGARDHHAQDAGFFLELGDAVVGTEERHVVVLGSHDEDPVKLLALADVTAQEVNPGSHRVLVHRLRCHPLFGRGRAREPEEAVL